MPLKLADPRLCNKDEVGGKLKTNVKLNKLNVTIKSGADFAHFCRFRTPQLHFPVIIALLLKTRHEYRYAFHAKPNLIGRDQSGATSQRRINADSFRGNSVIANNRTVRPAEKAVGIVQHSASINRDNSHGCVVAAALARAVSLTRTACGAGMFVCIARNFVGSFDDRR